MAQSRSFTFTINNYDDDDIIDSMELFSVYDASYLIMGFEQGEEETPHIQAYVYFNEKKSRKQLSKVISRAHIEIAKGNPQQNYDYCSKDAQFMEFGILPVKGKRTDILDMHNDIKQGKSVQEIADKYPSNFYRYSGSIEKAYNIIKKENDRCQVIYTTEDPYRLIEDPSDVLILDTSSYNLSNFAGEKVIVYTFNPHIDIVKRFCYNIPLVIKRGYLTKKCLPEIVYIHDPNAFFYSQLDIEENHMWFKNASII